MKTVLVKNQPVDITSLVVGDIFMYKGKQYKASSTSYERDGETFIDVETEENAFWKMARQIDLESKLISAKPITEGQHAGFMFQGELVAPSIQGNFEGVDKPRFFVYNVFDIEEQTYFSPALCRAICDAFDLAHVPVLHKLVTLRELFPNATQDTIVKELLEYADGPSSLGGKFREGLVFKRTDGQFSFKSVSNRYLLKTGE